MYPPEVNHGSARRKSCIRLKQYEIDKGTERIGVELRIVGVLIKPVILLRGWEYTGGRETCVDENGCV